MRKALLMAALAVSTYCVQAHSMTPLADDEMAAATSDSVYNSSMLGLGVKEKLRTLLDTTRRAPTTQEILQMLGEVSAQNRVKLEVIMFNEQLVAGGILNASGNGSKLPQEIKSIGCNVLDLDGNRIGLLRLRGLSLEDDGIDIGVK